MKHLDDLGDNGQVLWRHFDPDIEGFDQLCAHLLSWIWANVSVWLQQCLGWMRSMNTKTSSSLKIWCMKSSNDRRRGKLGIYRFIVVCRVDRGNGHWWDVRQCKRRMKKRRRVISYSLCGDSSAYDRRDRHAVQPRCILRVQHTAYALFILTP